VAATSARATPPALLDAAVPRTLVRDARTSDGSSAAIDPRSAAIAPLTSRHAEVPPPAADPIIRATPAEVPALFDRLAVQLAAPERKALVRLDPPELGRLSISLSLEPNGHVRAEMRAEQPNGYAALESRVNELHASLLARGFTSASVSLSLGLADPRSDRSWTRDEGRRAGVSSKRTLADSEVRAMLPASAGAIDMWA